MDLYNRALAQPVRELGPYRMRFADCVQMTDQQGNTYQLSYLLNFGNLGVINIEIIDDQGVYLSDKVRDHQATNAEIDTQDAINNLEIKMVADNTHQQSLEAFKDAETRQKINELLTYTLETRATEATKGNE